MSDGPDAFDGEVLDLIVPESLANVRVDKVLAMLTGLSRSDAADIVSAGRVTVDDKPVAKPSTPVVGGRRLYAELPEADSGVVEADPRVVVDVVVDDPDFAVVNKAPGQVVH